MILTVPKVKRAFGKGEDHKVTKAEVRTFIEEMEHLNDHWTEEEVERVYGNSTLEDALTDRRSAITMYNNSVFNAFKAMTEK